MFYIKKLFDRTIKEKSAVDIITNTNRVNAITRYYDVPELRAILEPLENKTRWKLLDEIGDNTKLFDNFTIDSDLLKGFNRYRFEPNLMSEFGDSVQQFLKNENEDLLLFLKRHSSASDEGFLMIKSNPKVHISRLLEYPEATHHTEYFNTRRAEMLPPNFYNTTGNGGVFKKVEIDSAIDTEILYGGKARPIIKNIENGDVAMVGGSLNGKKIDFMGLEPSSYKGWSKKYNRNYNRFVDSIKDHISKLNEEPYVDIIIIDYKYFETTSILSGKEASYIKNQVDSYIQTNLSEYLNSNKLIKINS